jgi:uncharacterized protein YcfL
MKRSLLKYSAWISLILLLAVGCRSPKILTRGEQAGLLIDSVSAGLVEKTTLKAKVIYKERGISGLLLIKNTGDGNFKIAFYNELGMTYLEGAMENTSKRKNLAINNIAPVIQNKFFMKNFEKALRIVLTDYENTRFPSSPLPLLPADDETDLAIQFHNGFRLELAPKSVLR